MAYREELKNRINEFIESQTGNICVSLFDLKEQDGFSIDGDRRVPSASMIKLVIMAELMRRVCAGELVADLLVSASSLHGTTIAGNLIPALIDEIPMIAVMAAFANGQTVISDAAELKVKESDRIATVTAGLRAMGCDITPTDDGMIIRGGKTLHGAEIDSYLDHRIAMSFAVAALAADGVTSIKDADCVKISYPNFYDDLLGLAK